MQDKNLTWYLVKIDRIAAWVLFFSVLLFGISGYAMTKGYFDYDLATTIHNIYLPVVGMIAFVYHSFYAIRLAFKRWGIWDSFGKYLLSGIYLIIICLFIFVAYIYGSNLALENDSDEQATQNTQDQNSSDQASTNDSQNQSSDNATTNTTKTFTAEELAKYNGKNGQPAYVAVNGKVYDLSSVFRNGSHAGHTAGKDLSSAFSGKHDSSFLSGYSVVGDYKN